MDKWKDSELEKMKVGIKCSMHGSMLFSFSTSLLFSFNYLLYYILMFYIEVALFGVDARMEVIP